MYKLALIIPVYNVKEFIVNCICSIASRKSDEILYVFVDDGCPEKSIDFAIAELPRFFERPNVIVLRKSNGGLSSARNEGLSYLRLRNDVEYFAFIDSDDYVLNCYADVIFEAINESKADIIQFDSINVSFESNFSDSDNFAISPSIHYCGSVSTVRKSIYIQARWHVWRRVYNFKKFSDLDFAIGMYFEDMIYCGEIYSRDFSIAIILNKIYCYRENAQSITRSLINDEKYKMYQKSFEYAFDTGVKFRLPIFYLFHVGYVSSGNGVSIDREIPSLSIDELNDYVKGKGFASKCKVVLYRLLPKLHTFMMKIRRVR